MLYFKRSYNASLDIINHINTRTHCKLEKSFTECPPHVFQLIRPNVVSLKNESGKSCISLMVYNKKSTDTRLLAETISIPRC